MNDSIIEKAVLAMNKLQGRDDWRIWAVTMRIALGRTWVYVEGDKTSPPPANDPSYNIWKEEDLAAHRRIWLALDKDAMQDVLPYTESHASELFKALKTLYEPMGATAELYARRDYENVKLPNYDNLDSFMTAMINAAHRFNKEIDDANSRIKNRDIAMRIIHDLPPALFSLQTILLENAVKATGISKPSDSVSQLPKPAHGLLG